MTMRMWSIWNINRNNGRTYHEEENKTHTSVKNLSNKEKIEEIVRLIGGSVNDQSAITHASKMLDDAKQYKEKL